MLFRRLRHACVTAPCRRPMSMRALVVQHGAPLAAYYFITNEMLVCLITYLLHYNYFGKDDLISVLDSLGASRFIDLKSIEGKSWSLFGGRLEVSVRLVANFTAASLFMSLWTPLQLPLCVATYPYLRRVGQRVFGRRATAKPAKTPATGGEK